MSDPQAAKRIRDLLGGVLGPLLGLAVIVLFFTIADNVRGGGEFATVRNMRVVLTQTSTVAVAALGMTIIIIAGGIDLSAGTALTLCATVMAYCIKEDYSITLCVLAALGTGCLCGMMNGALISVLRVVPFIVTLGTMTIFLGVGKLLSDESTIFPARDQIPIWLQNFCSSRPPNLLEVPLSNACFWSGMWVFTVCTLTWFLGYLTLVNRKSVGRVAKALNKPASYALAGLLIAIAGMLQFLGFKWAGILYFFESKWAGILHFLEFKWNVGLPNNDWRVWVALLSAIFVAMILRYSVFGRHLFALGWNKPTIPLIRINILFNKVVAYKLAGLLMAVAGMLHFLEFRWNVPYPNIAWGVWVALLLAIIVAMILRYTVFGRHVFALGSNESTARLCGINITMTKIAAYTLAGLFVGIAGIYHFSILKLGNPTEGQGRELDIIAAVVIGGGSLSGGRGSVLGTLTGAAIMAVIRTGCIHLEISAPYQDMIIGAIIIAAVAVDQLRQRRSSD